MINFNLINDSTDHGDDVYIEMNITGTPLSRRVIVSHLRHDGSEALSQAVAIRDVIQAYHQLLESCLDGEPENDPDRDYQYWFNG